jgi:tyrosinase
MTLLLVCKDFPEAWWQDIQDQQVLPTARPDNVHLAESLPINPTTDLPRSVLGTWHGSLLDAVSTGRLINANGDQFDTGIDELGHATEPSRAEGVEDVSRVPDPNVYGAFHGAGHIFIAYSQGIEHPPGVMGDTDTAIRDPVFYRWNRHIDDLAFQWQEEQPPHDLSKDAGGVELRHQAQTTADRPAESLDLILIEANAELADLSDTALRSRLAGDLGGEHWDEGFADAEPGTNELHTEMLTRPLELEPVASVERDIHYLDQRPFIYAVRMGNTKSHDHDVTVRLFFVADRLFANRRMWIELDKFKHRITGDRSIAIRRASESSVIRKPGQKPPGPTRRSSPSDEGWESGAYCDCGWPYNLLLPRSTRRGLKFWLAAIITDWDSDQLKTSECGSMSYCGAKDSYPDKKSMGYPFDRPISGRAIARALSERPNMAARSFRIRRLPDR